MSKVKYKAAKKVSKGKVVVVRKDGKIEPTKKNRKIKYDFASLKNEFFVSEFDEVMAFFQDRFKTYTSHIKGQTNGWSSEKKEWKRKIAEEANKRAFDDEVRTKAGALRKVLNSFLEDFKDKEIPCEKCSGTGNHPDKENVKCPNCEGVGKITLHFKDYPVKIRRQLWEIWRIENNLPTTLSKFTQLPGPVGESPLSEHTRKILKANGINPEDTMN